MAGAESGTGKFDEVASQYDDIHAKGMSPSGEPSGYFAQYKIDRLKRLSVTADASVLDFGCGVGNVTELLAENFSSVVGYDPSAGSLEVARKRLPGLTFYSDENLLPRAEFDVVVLAGVMHHVSPDQRHAVITRASDTLKAGGRLVVFEHNPYNPVTRRVVDNCPFDEDAILLPPREVRSVLTAAGLDDVKQAFIVFFPHALAFLRKLEPAIGFFPLGAQTMTVGVRRSE
ncbi:MAG TPA: class I SAM-dependent methyltransferase [Galbitalea sp.]|jgi:SAM-dependent methyltransferase|nr:class I SAM-dependent methyltransferase [Galbitalea sp.]